MKFDEASVLNRRKELLVYEYGLHTTAPSISMIDANVISMLVAM